MKVLWARPAGGFSFGLDVPSIPLDARGLIVLRGPNGSGKSSIMNSITTALFGKNDLGYETDDVANSVLGEGCDLEVGFEAEGVVYSADYCRKFKKDGGPRVTDVFLKDASNPDLRKESLSATLAEIRRLVGMDYNQFVATSYLGTQTAPKFLTGTDAERMAVITPFLGLGVWDRVQEKIRAELKVKRVLEYQMSGQLAATTSNTFELEQRVVEESHLKNLDDQVAQLSEGIAAAQAESNKLHSLSSDRTKSALALESDMFRLNADIKVLEKHLKAVRDSLDSQITTVNYSTPDNHGSKIRELETRKQLATSEISAKIEAASAPRSDMDAIEQSIQNAASQLSAYDALIHACDEQLGQMVSAGLCPTCHSVVSEEHLASVRLGLETTKSEHEKNRLDWAAVKQESEGLKAQFVEESRGIVAVLRKQLADTGIALNAEIAAARMASQNELSTWRAEKIAAIRTENATQISSMESEIGVKNNQVTTLRAQVNDLRNDPESTRIEARVRELKELVEASNKSIIALTGEKSQHLEVRRQFEEAKAKVADLKAKVAAAQVEIEDHEFLERHVGDKGFKRYKLRSCIGFMNQRMRYYVQDILGLSMQVWFQDRELKKSARNKKPEALTAEDWTDRFEMFVKDGPKDSVPVGMYSGGERTLISLSLIGTLWETANTFGSGGTNLLMVDEPFGLLQESNRDRAIALLEHWRNLGKTILVSDNTGAVDAVRPDMTISISKENHVSKYTIQ